MMISDYRLEQNLPYDLTRPVAEMAAFFDILPQSDSTDVLKNRDREADGCVGDFADGRRHQKSKQAIYNFTGCTGRMGALR